MTTITSLELRKNLDTYAKRAAKDENIRVTYRGKISFSLGPDPKTQACNIPAILAKAREFHSRIPKKIKDQYSTDESIDKLIYDHRMEKYGQQK